MGSETGDLGEDGDGGAAARGRQLGSAGSAGRAEESEASSSRVTVAGGVAESQAAAAVCRKPPPSAGPVSPPFTNERTQGSGVRRQGSEATSPLRSVFGECPCGRPHSLV